MLPSLGESDDFFYQYLRGFPIQHVPPTWDSPQRGALDSFVEPIGVEWRSCLVFLSHHDSARQGDVAEL